MGSFLLNPQSNTIASVCFYHIANDQSISLQTLVKSKVVKHSLRDLFWTKVTQALKVLCKSNILTYKCIYHNLFALVFEKEKKTRYGLHACGGIRKSQNICGERPNQMLMEIHKL